METEVLPPEEAVETVEPLPAEPVVVAAGPVVVVIPPTAAVLQMSTAVSYCVKLGHWDRADSMTDSWDENQLRSSLV